MTRDDMLRIAREAGWPEPWVNDPAMSLFLGHFAARIIDAEHEAVIAIVNDNTDGDGLCCADDLLAAIRARREK